MRIFCVTLIFVEALLVVGSAMAGGLTKPVSAGEYILGNGLTMHSFFAKKMEIKQGGTDLEEEIYEFHAKSPLKAFALSLAIPGAGQFYNGSKIKAGTFLAADIILWSGYLMYHGKASDKEKAYKAYADEHYLASVYRDWWETRAVPYQDSFSHRIYFDANGNPNRNHEYYENIGKYDQFQVGWDDIGLNHEPPPLPGGAPLVSPHRSVYLDLRCQANDYFSNAKTMAMISIGNHLISAFEAAIGAKKYNRGTRQYSLQLKSKNIDGKVAPFMVLSAGF